MCVLWVDLGNTTTATARYALRMDRNIELDKANIEFE